VEVSLLVAGDLLVSACLLSLPTSTPAILSVDDDLADFILPEQSLASANGLSANKTTRARYFTITSFFLLKKFKQF